MAEPLHYTKRGWPLLGHTVDTPSNRAICFVTVDSNHNRGTVVLDASVGDEQGAHTPDPGLEVEN